MYNNIPKNGLCPADILFSGMLPRHHLKDLHVLGRPVFVLDPKLQQGQKLSRWEQHSHQGMLVG